ncbi:LacI family DNA-binding transcriptional regulator [Sphingomonas hengshuiensis]|uniref:LacI family transcriptional regulator n=1 Tax=Sphingomonas hengshuiensis TaxID=1609977 RepID=A0A7U4LFJ7_9SPHN|nr:LacI family DNA-binding transcriptional regulator [Sphingomonas hengshuiensis]AJP72500.1 LacI family transcriptional regulator [Sphingomonas hengshuiensis]
MAVVRDLKAFAALAGVSTATASRALSGTGRVSVDTRARINQLADELGYRPNLVARNLRLQCTRTIGVLVPLGHERTQHLSDPFFSTMTGFLADELAERGYDLLLSRILPRDERWLDDYVGSGRVDGIIIVGHSDQYDVIEEVSRRYQPMVAWGGVLEGQHHCSVGSDNRKGGWMAARHLIAQGCRTVAFAGPIQGHEFGERLAGVRQALDEAGLGAGMSVLPVRFEPSAAYADIRDWLGAAPDLPDGIVAGADVTAIGALRALTEAGVRVPQDVRVMGYDGLPIGEHFAPSLSTIDQNLRLGARLMTEMVIARLGGEDTQSQLIEPRLVQRESA